MNAGWIVLGVLGAVALIVLGTAGAGAAAYNDLVRESEAIDAQSKQVDVAYQRAFRLVPQLTTLVQQHMANETAVIERATALRSGLAPAGNGSFESKDQYLSDLVSFVALVGNRVEAYPQLRSSDLYADLLFEITNSENKIAMEKLRYNDRVQTYNAHRRECCLPVLVANMFGFGPKGYTGFAERPLSSDFPANQTI